MLANIKMYCSLSDCNTVKLICIVSDILVWHDICFKNESQCQFASEEDSARIKCSGPLLTHFYYTGNFE